jgi:hypothetical protein
MRVALGAPKNDDSSEFDVADARLEWASKPEN